MICKVIQVFIDGSVYSRGQVLLSKQGVTYDIMVMAIDIQVWRQFYMGKSR